MKRFIFTSLLVIASGLIASPAVAQINTNQINWGARSGCGTATYPWVPADAQCEAPGSGGGTGVLHTGAGAPSEGTAATVSHIQGTGATGCSKAYASSVTAGHLLLVTEVGETGMSTSLQPTDTVGTVFVLLGSVGFGGGVTNEALWGGYAAASGADTVAWSCGAVTGATQAQDEFSGASTFVDQTAMPVLNTSNPSTSLTPTLSGDLVFGYGAWLWSNGYGLSFTAGSGFTLGGTYAGAVVANAVAEEYIAGGTTGSTAVAISQSGNSGTGASWGGVAFYALHTGSVGNDGDWYVDNTTGVLYGPRQAGIYLPFAGGLGVVKADGTTITESAGVLTAPNTVSVNGSVVNTPNFNGTVPTAPGGNTLVTFQVSGSSVSGYVPTSGGGGCMTQQQTVLGSASSSITFTSIPGTCTDLTLEITGFDSNAGSGNSDVLIQFNSDTGSNYDWAYYTQGVSSGTGHTNTDTAAHFCSLNQSGLTNRPGSCLTQLFNYTATTGYKNLRTGWARYDNSGGGMFVAGFSADWKSTAAITSITLTMASGDNFAAGTVATLRGQ